MVKVIKQKQTNKKKKKKNNIRGLEALDGIIIS